MDPITSLAASAVAVLTPYLAEAGKEFTKDARDRGSDEKQPFIELATRN